MCSLGIFHEHTTSPSYVRHSWNIRSTNSRVIVPVPYLKEGTTVVIPHTTVHGLYVVYRAISSLLNIPLWSASRLKYCPEVHTERHNNKYSILTTIYIEREETLVSPYTRSEEGAENQLAS